MEDGSVAKKALEAALEAIGYGRLGIPGIEIAVTANQRVQDLTATWPAEKRAQFQTVAAALESRQFELDRGRNHFIKHFRAAHGASKEAWSPALKDEFDREFAAFTRRKAEAFDEVLQGLKGTQATQETPW